MTMRLLPDYSHAALRNLAQRLRAGGAVPPVLAGLVSAFGGATAAARLLDAVADERQAAESEADRRIELVWSGPEADGAGTRDTAAVVRELFGQAERSVIVSGYAVFDGETIFAALIDRMREVDPLSVTLFLNVARQSGDLRNPAEIVADYRRRFLARDWPWAERPKVFYDPRSLSFDASTRAVLHAKCVIVDDTRALVTSANLTEAAQYRNVECGVLVSDAAFVGRLAAQFHSLVDRGSVSALETSP